jgi:hypothetical protein
VSVALKRLLAAGSSVGLALSLTGQAAGSASEGHARHRTGAKGDAKVRVLDRPERELAKSLQAARTTAPAVNDEGTQGGGSSEATFPTPESVGVSSATLDAIAACESGGDPSAVSADGTYRGKYQFDYGTWASVGGSGDPAAAPEAEQDYRAALLYSRSGTSPWPICG